MTDTAKSFNVGARAIGAKRPRGRDVFALQRAAPEGDAIYAWSGAWLAMVDIAYEGPTDLATYAEWGADYADALYAEGAGTVEISKAGQEAFFWAAGIEEEEVSERADFSEAPQEPATEPG